MNPMLVMYNIIDDFQYNNDVVVRKKQVKVVHNKMSDFLAKVYDPYIEKNKYICNLNEGLGNIKKNTRKNIYDNFLLE